MSSIRPRATIVLACLLVLSLVSAADAQIVRRFGGGGVQVNAPFVRVNVGPGGATSVRAPFTAVNSPGRVFFGRRRRMMAQQQPQARQQQSARTSRSGTGSQAPSQAPTNQPEPEVADVDALPYPTAEQLAGMNDADLIETLRQMMARLHYRLSRLDTGEGWQKYLVLSREILGSPGSAPEAANFNAIEKMLPRYQSVQGDPQFAKISALPGFTAAFAALQEANGRAHTYQGSGQADGPTMVSPVGPQSTSPDSPVQPAAPRNEQLETLPTPQPTAVAPDVKRGERSILKRK